MSYKNSKYYFSNKSSVKKCRVISAIYHASNRVRDDQIEDECEYRDGILNIRKKLGFIFKERARGEDKKRSKAMVYGYWTEEDVRLRLAAELLKEKNSQIHGQTYIKGSAIQRFPDLYFLRFKGKEKTYTIDSDESNLESAAIEIKYFGLGAKPAYIKQAVRRDFSKLKSYQGSAKPKCHSGYFFCLDESGNAESIVKDEINKKKYKQHGLAAYVLVPGYSTKKLEYPGYFERFKRTERRIAYILSVTASEIVTRYNSIKNTIKVKEDLKYGTGFYIYINGKRPGYLSIVYPRCIKNYNGNSGELIILIEMKQKKDYGILKALPHQYKWIKSNNKYDKVKKLHGAALLDLTINKSDLSNVKKLHRCGKRIANLAKRYFNI